MSVWYYLLGKGLRVLAQSTYEYRIEGQNNLPLVERCLKKGSAIAYFNHISEVDGFLVLTLLLDNLGMSITRIGGMVSQKHYDFRREPKDALLLRLARPLRINLSPVVQHYDTESYTPERSFRLLRRAITNAKEILTQRGGMYFIAPEGTRSSTSSLQKAQSGIEHLKRYGSVCYFPIGIVPLGYEKSIGSEFELTIGQPFRVDDIRGEIPEGLSLADGMMLRLARLLPEGMRGFYASYLK